MIRLKEILDEAKYFGKHPKAVLQSLIRSLTESSEAVDQLKSFKRKSDYDSFWGDITKEIGEIEEKLKHIKDVLEKDLKI